MANDLNQLSIVTKDCQKYVQQALKGRPLLHATVVGFEGARLELLMTMGSAEDVLVDCRHKGELACFVIQYAGVTCRQKLKNRQECVRNCQDIILVKIM